MFLANNQTNRSKSGMNIESLGTTFYIVGLSYKKADVKTRSSFSVSKANQVLLLKEAKVQGIDGIIILSTCNRTEIMGFAKHPFQLISLLCKYSHGSVEDFANVSSVFKNKEAIRHLFDVATGLDSQILGDYEIVGQLKSAFKLAKKQQTLNAYLERLTNLVLQASKKVKNTTKLSSGTTSISYAAIQYLMDTDPHFEEKNILVYGLGEIGKNTCKNLAEYTQCSKVTLVNRTPEKAVRFVKEHPQINHQTLDKLTQEIEKAQILIVSTGAEIPTVSKQQVRPDKELLILDLSMPENVDLTLKQYPGIELVNIDELSKITDQTLAERKNEIPKAEAIISVYKAEFMEWLDHRKFTPAVNALKASLTAMQKIEIDFQRKKTKDFNSEHAQLVTSRFIQKITTQFVKHLKDEQTTTNQSIEVIAKIFEIKDDDN